LVTINMGVAAVAVGSSPDGRATRPIIAAPSPTPTPAPYTQRPTPPPLPRMIVAGRSIASEGIVNVRDAFRRADVVPHDGRWLGIRSHRSVGYNSDRAKLYVNGIRATYSTRVAPGAQITFTRGTDRVEGTAVRRIVTPADPTGTGLYVGGQSGLVLKTVGAVSGEVVRSTVVRKRILAHLKVPGALALTFDDGPDSTWTPQVLAVLAKHHVKAVFCMIGQSANSEPATARRVAAAGHLLCDHTMHHDEHISSRSDSQIRKDIHDCKVTITKTAGVAPRFFRAPGGDWSSRVESIAREEGLTPLKWTVDPRDWSRPGTSAIVSRVLSAVRPGGVVLLHDGGGNRSQTLAALDQLLDQLPKLGYHFTTPSP
jgi:peptidoglycan/xylan/chitin deacetylase (PgdA/CDA1 family)